MPRVTVVAGERRFEASRERVFELLTSPDVIAAAMPAVRSHQVVDADHWLAKVKPPLPLAPSLTIRFEVLDRRPPEHARMHAHGGGADVTSTFDLEADGDATVMRWRTELRLAGRAREARRCRAARRSRAVRPTARSTKSHAVCDLGVALLDAEPRPVPGAREDLARAVLLVAFLHLDPHLVDRPLRRARRSRGAPPRRSRPLRPRRAATRRAGRSPRAWLHVRRRRRSSRELRPPAGRAGRRRMRVRDRPSRVQRRSPRAGYVSARAAASGSRESQRQRRLRPRARRRRASRCRVHTWWWRIITSRVSFVK